MAWLQARVKKEEIEPGTVDAAYRALRALCNWLAREEQISSSPFTKIKQPKVPDKVPKQVTIDDYQKLLLSIKINRWLDVRDRFIIIVLFWCGLRVEELVNLNLDDIDMQHNLIRVRAGKGGDPRFTPMLPLVKQSFLDYLYHRPNVDTRALFPACNGSYALNNGVGDSGVRTMLARRCREAGIERKNPHAFRHGIAMHLLNELGTDMSFIAELLGHKDEKPPSASTPNGKQPASPKSTPNCSKITNSQNKHTGGYSKARGSIANRPNVQSNNHTLGKIKTGIRLVDEYPFLFCQVYE